MEPLSNFTSSTFAKEFFYGKTVSLWKNCVVMEKLCRYGKTVSLWKNCVVIILLSLAISHIYAKPVVYSSYKFQYTDEFSDDTTIVRKMYDPETKKYWIESDDGRITSTLDIELINRNKDKAFRAKHGAKSKEIVALLEKKDKKEKVKVHIALALPQTQCLDKTKHSEEELRKSSLDALAIEQKHIVPIRKRILKDHKIIPEKATPEDSTDYTIITNMTKEAIEDLSFEEDIATIEEYIEPEVAACGEFPSGCQNFKSLANSAYNPPSGMNSNYMGNNINAATFESGIHPDVVSCFSARGSILGTIETSPDLTGDHPHSNWTFECLAQTATKAKLFHRSEWSYANNINWIINNNINTVSRSTTLHGNATIPENRTVDHFAYRYPYTTFVTLTANRGYCYEVNWQCYNAVQVGNVRHTNETTYELMGLGVPCSTGVDWRVGWPHPISQGKNPVSRLNPPINFPFILPDCVAPGGCATNNSSDREMPHLLAPGYSASTDATGGPCGHSTTCIENTFHFGGWAGTSFSAPVANGIAACIQSAKPSAFKLYPELVRTAMILTARNIHAGYWNPTIDGIDGAGVIAGADAVYFARNASQVSPSSTAVQNGYYGGFIPQNTGSAYNITFNIAVPSTFPAGKHLRIVFTWDSSPSMAGGSTTNEAADLDLVVPGKICPGKGIDNWGSWESTVEVADLLNNQLTPGSPITAQILVWPFTIPTDAYNKTPLNGIYYGIGWTWVKDTAN